MSNELLTLKNLKQYFPVGKDRFVRAVDGVDLTINHGDVMGLVGPAPERARLPIPLWACTG